MTDDRSPFFFIDEDYPVPEGLPKSIQADVDMLEMLAEEGKRDALFDQYVELLESNIKGHADVDMLEMLAEEGKRDALFDQYVELLESNIKGHVIDKRMTYEKGKALLARYGIHLA